MIYAFGKQIIKPKAEEIEAENIKAFESLDADIYSVARYEHKAETCYKTQKLKDMHLVSMIAILMMAASFALFSSWA